MIVKNMTIKHLGASPQLECWNSGTMARPGAIQPVSGYYHCSISVSTPFNTKVYTVFIPFRPDNVMWHEMCLIRKINTFVLKGEVCIKGVLKETRVKKSRKRLKMPGFGIAECLFF